MNDKTININVPVLARVEGEGALELKIKNQQIDELRLRIYEPPRYFEKFLEGRNYYDIPDTVARICGICPVAYQMSAVHAIDSIFGIRITPWIRAMRRAMYCGEWLQSHSLHIHMLALPDYLGFNNVIQMAEKYPGEVQRGLKIQSLGNQLIALFGGRSVHPVGVRAGGFYRAPDTLKVQKLVEELKNCLPDAMALVEWTASIDLPSDEQDFVSVALRHDDEYPLNEGRLVSDQGLDINISEYQQHFEEIHQPHSTALHSLLNNRPYLVGPLARLNLNKDKLPTEVITLLDKTGIHFPSKNMFHSMLARAVEIHYCMLEAIRLLENYTPETPAYIEQKPVKGTGYGCTEAPRGILWHRYELDESGQVVSAIIIPPTSQNQARIEEDIKLSLQHLGLDKNEDTLRLHAEKVIRNYDPCISCATHFLKLDVERLVSTETKAATENKIRSRPTKIIGIGSPFGSDKTGWQLIEALRLNIPVLNNEQQQFELISLDRPGMQLIEYLKDTDRVIIIDAIKMDNSDKKLIKLYPDNLDSSFELISGHGLGLEESLLLAKQLGPLPEIVIIGINTSLFSSGTADSHQIQQLVDAIQQEFT